MAKPPSPSDKPEAKEPGATSKAPSTFEKLALKNANKGRTRTSGNILLRRSLAAIFVIALVSAVFLYLGRGETKGEVEFRIATAQVQNVRRTVSASGVIEPWTTVDLKSKAGGRIESLLVDVGDRVRAGQVIARIDPSDSALSFNQAEADTASARAKESQTDEQYRLQVTQSQLSVVQARSQLKASQAALSASRARLATARHESQAQPALNSAAISAAQAARDSARQDRAQLDATQPQDFASAKSTYDQASANMVVAKLLYERKEALAQKGYVALQEVDDARAAFSVTQAQVDAAKTRLDKLGDQQRAALAASDAKVRQAEAQLRSASVQSISETTKLDAVREAEAAYEQAGAQVSESLAQLKQAIANGANNAIRQLDILGAKAAKSRAEASLANAKATLDQTVVRAPSEGVVLQKYVEQGTIITSGLSFNSTGTSIVQLGNILRLYVDVAVDETDIASVREGQKVDVSVDAFPNMVLSGRVIKISPRAEVDQNVTSVHVRVELSNKSRGFQSLKPAMNATCEFIVDEHLAVLAVPSDAVHQDGHQSYVEIAQGGRMAPADAKLGLSPDPNQLVGVVTIRRVVTTRLEGNDATEITSGLRSGERIVLQRIEPSAASTTAQRSSPFAGGTGMGPPGTGGGRGTGGSNASGGSRGGR